MNEIECETCVKRKTVYCPNHADCYDTINKPYYQNRIMLLEENNQLKEQLQQQEEEYDRMFALWHSRKLIKKFDDEFDEEDKKKNPNRDYACICPDAEEVYKRYYELKEQLIAYLEEKIKQCNKLLNTGNPKPYGEERNLYENSLLRYTEILNIIKGGKINE